MSTAVSNNSVSDYIASTQNSSNPGAFAPNKTMDQTDFLRLLTTQLKNQDPNKPMDPTNFVTDMTQMSQLEATTQLNASVMSMTEGFQNLQTMQASSLIGKSVLAEGGEFSHTEGSESSFKLNLDEPLTDVTVVVSDANGAVKEMDIGDLGSGEKTVSWDGTDDHGNPMAEGVYKLIAYGTDKDGEMQSVKTVVGTKVNSVSINSDGTMKLTLATGEDVDMSAVRKISEQRRGRTMATYDLNALSGINAASNGLGVISNNLANAQTVGFKASRAEFADMFSGAQKSPGNGVRVGAITQDFSVGSINDTGRELDMAVDGEGFFILEDKTGKYENVYTRNGSFKLDKEGYITDQGGNRVQGYLLNETLSTETDPVFSTALNSIDLDDLNKIPKATSEMGYDINLDGEEVHNVDPAGTNTGVDGTDDSVGSSQNLAMLADPENNTGAGGLFGGSPDYFYPKTIYDSLGGEHTLNANFYKRDVVPEPNAGSANTSGEKYTSWIVQYTITAQDDQGNSQYTGHVMDPNVGPPQTPSNRAGQVYELRFDTDGNYLGAYAPTLDGNGQYDPTAAIAGGPDSDPAAAVGATDLGTAGWAPVTGNPQLNFMIDNPLTGATDPLGGATQGTPAAFEIDLDMQEMSQFAGSYTQRGTTQNGYAIGDLVGVNTNSDGVIEARYSNGRSVPVAQLALANFNDKNAMEKLGGQTYAETFGSGPVQIGTAENNGFGSISAGSLEYSNVDTTGELVNMIQTQRTYQASAQVISTSQTLTQTILNL